MVSGLAGLRHLLSKEGGLYPILSCFLSCLTASDVYSLQRVCRAFRRLPAHLGTVCMNINVHLRAFVSDPTAFRVYMGKHDGLISRGFALNFFVPMCSQTPYLDVFIEEGGKADSFAQYLESEEQYAITQYQQNAEGRGNEIGAEAHTHGTILLYNAERETTIRFTLANGSPLLAILATSCTTADMNFISRDKAYSIFPSLTIQKHKLYPLRGLDDEFGRRMKEYAHHGWTTRDIVWPDWTSEKLRGTGCRRAGDRFSLIVSLPGDFPALMSTPNYVAEHAQFEISGSIITVGPNRGKKRADDYTIKTRAFTSHALRHRYAIDPFSDWKDYVEERLKRWILIELLKMDPEVRPQRVTPTSPLSIYSISLPDSFVPPGAWDYADDQMPEWYQEWGKNKFG
ncbi:hypothetical protein LY76DRAFT_597811 [Colletotrichum caudatum]|nr:hypothetical protein LY76DRAFT_597811 [Colletotrichum caudatum]